MEPVRYKPRQERSPRATDDEKLALQVRTALDAEARLDARQIEVLLLDGVLSVDGWVTSEEQRALALDVVRAAGATAVEDALLVQTVPGDVGPLVAPERPHGFWRGWLRRLLGTGRGNLR